MIRKLLTRIVLATQLPRNPFEGEMLPLERLRLYQWMMAYRPKVVLEVGTGVGGSTFYMSEALKQYGGQLHTCDPLRQPPKPFLERFANTLHYHPLRSQDLIDRMTTQGYLPDFLFFDGPEIPSLALEDLQRIEPFLADGCLFAMHDWEQAGSQNPRIVSIKAQHVRPYVEQSRRWQKLEVLKGHEKNVWWTKGRYDSVGLCLYRFQSDNSIRSLAA